ncbi:PrpF protein [Crassisporium funariophilum]|nr:PrpF protein [Crassisporium funariophilum]
MSGVFFLECVQAASTTFRRNTRRTTGITLAAMQRHLYTSSNENHIAATFLRGGTSKGIFLNKSVLPAERSEWQPIFLGIMGSPDPEYGRQLNGMGGGVSSLSKIMVVGSSSPEQKARGIEVEYTFAQIGIRDSSIDYSGNCGNLSSMIGVFAIDEGICPPPKGLEQATIRSFNTNTQKVIDTTFPVSEVGIPILDLPEATVAGVPGKASQIILDFVNPGGARTGKLLPSGNPTDILTIRALHSQTSSPLSPSSSRTVRVSLIDATNPTVFVRYSELDEFLPMEDYVNGKSPATEEVSPILELIRQGGAKTMGLDPSAQAQPKIAILSAPQNADDISHGVNIVIHALSMGVLHKAVPMTVGLCLGVASKIEGTLAWDITQGLQNTGSSQDDLVRIRHPGGLVDVGAKFGDDGQVKSAKVVRTGRRLMKGVVWY